MFDTHLRNTFQAPCGPKYVHTPARYELVMRSNSESWANVCDRLWCGGRGLRIRSRTASEIPLVTWFRSAKPGKRMCLATRCAARSLHGQLTFCVHVKALAGTHCRELRAAAVSNLMHDKHSKGGRECSTQCSRCRRSLGHAYNEVVNRVHV